MDLTILGDEILFPAHAGVIPKRRALTEAETAVPRTRGGDPCRTEKRPSMAPCSPHTRG